MKFIKKYSNFIILGLIVISIILLFFPCGEYVYLKEPYYISSGWQLIFGRKIDGVEIFGVNISGIAMLVLMLFAIVLPFIGVLKSKYTSLFQSIVIAFADIFYFFLPITVNHKRYAIAHNYTSQRLIGLYIGAAILLVAALIALSVFLVNISEKEEKK